MVTKMKRILGVLLTLALVLGLMPGMSLTAYAETALPADGSEAGSGDVYFVGFTSGLESGDHVNSGGEMFDGNANTKACIGFNGSYSIEFSYSKPIIPTKYYFRTGNDTYSYDRRNPSAWQLEGKISDETWTVLDSKSGQTYSTDNNTATAFSISNTKEYKVFRLTITDINSSGRDSYPVYGDHTFQLSEVYMSGSLRPAGSSVTLSGGANATIDGATSQAGLTGAMTTVTYTASTGYYFAEFADITNNGITATRTSSTVVTVSGTPTSDATITVPDAVEKTAATVTKAPIAKSLTYTGSAQELVTAGEAENGTMQYAIGTATEATEPYTTSIPAKTDAGTYYVWYKAVGDENHTDSVAEKVEVTISSSSQGGGEVIGNGEKSTKELKEEFKNEPPKDNSAAKNVLGENATTADAIDALAGEKKNDLINNAINDAGTLKVEGEGAKLNGTADVAAAVLAPSQLVQAVLGDNVVIDLKVADKSESSVDTTTKNKIAETAGAKVNNGLFFFDADLFVTVNNGKPTAVTKFAKAISFTREIPENLRGAGRSFSAIYTHDNNGTLESGTLEDQDKDPNTFTGSTDKLCTMALVYTQSTSNSSTPVTAESASPKSDQSSSNGTSLRRNTYTSSSSDSKSSSSSSKSEKSYSKGSSKGYYTKTGKKTAEYDGPAIKRSAKSATVPAKVKIGKKTYKVTSISSFAFTGYDKLETVTIGENVIKIEPDAFSGCEKLKVLKIKSKKLTKDKIKNCLRGSKIDTVIILKKAWGKFKLYKKIFTKKNTGASHKVKVKKR